MRPERAFLWLGSILGTLLALLTPPFQVPDEPQHFFLAFHVSELGALDHTALNRNHATGWSHPGALLPRSLAVVVDRSRLAETMLRPERKVGPAQILAALRVPLDADDREYLPLIRYPPIGYVPQAAGIGVGRLLGAPPLALLYLGRLSALAAWVALVFVAVRLTPVLKWTYVLVALMPMSLHLAASQSVDGVVVGLTFVLTAQLLRWAYDDARPRIGRADLAWLLLTALALALSKAPYLVSLALLLLVPPAKLGGRARHALALGVILAACAAAYGAWSLHATSAAAPGPSIDMARTGAYQLSVDVSQRAQLASIVSRPLAFAAVLVTTLSVLGVYYLHSFVGLLGWLDTVLPAWLPYVYLAALVAAATLGDFRGRVSWAARGLGLAIVALVALVAHVFLYVVDSPWPEMKVVMGFQGRYLIPVAPLAFLAFLPPAGGLRVTRATAAALIAFVVLASAVAGHALVRRFYVAGAELRDAKTLAPRMREFWPAAGPPPATRPP